MKVLASTSLCATNLGLGEVSHAWQCALVRSAIHALLMRIGASELADHNPAHCRVCAPQDQSYDDVIRQPALEREQQKPGYDGSPC
jgi:hypothetical protein